MNEPVYTVVVVRIILDSHSDGGFVFSVHCVLSLLRCLRVRDQRRCGCHGGGEMRRSCCYIAFRSLLVSRDCGCEWKKKGMGSVCGFPKFCERERLDDMAGSGNGRALNWNTQHLHCMCSFLQLIHTAAG